MKHLHHAELLAIEIVNELRWINLADRWLHSDATISEHERERALCHQAEHAQRLGDTLRELLKVLAPILPPTVCTIPAGALSEADMAELSRPSRLVMLATQELPPRRRCSCLWGNARPDQRDPDCPRHGDFPPM